MGSAPFVPTFFKSLEAEAGGMLLVMLEGTQLLYLLPQQSSALARTRAMERLIVGRVETDNHPAPNHLTVLRVYPCVPERAN